MILSFVLSAALVAQGQPSQFDLDCTGQMVSSVDQMPGIGETTRTRVHYRVDLDRNLYCMDDCRRSASIASHSTTELVLDAPGSGARRIERRVNLTTGAYASNIAIPQDGLMLRLVTEGTCERRAYTPIP